MMNPRMDATRPKAGTGPFRAAASAAIALTVFAAPAALAVPELGFTELNILGDSLSDAGRFQSINDADGGPGISPRYNPANGRFSSGPIWADQLTTKYPELTVNNPALGGAFVGSYETSPGFVADNAADVDTGVQLDDFGNVQSQIASLGPIAPDARTLLWAGSNDIIFIGAPGIGAGAFTAEQFLSGLVQDVVNSVLTLINNGASPDTIYVGNAPTLGIIPLATAGGPDVVAALGGLSAGFNAGLSAALAAVSADITVIDFAAALLNVTGNAAALGFENATDPCVTAAGVCADPETFVFWDTIHPTSRVHSLIGDVIEQAVAEPVVGGPTPVPAPATALLVLVGFVGFAGARRARS